MATKKQTAPHVWSASLLAFGAAVIVVENVAVGVKAFHTADRTITVLGLPVDAVLGVLYGVLAGAIAFGGAVVTSWLYTQPTKGAQKQAALAMAVTLCASGLAVWNLSSSLAWYRHMAEAPRFARTAEWSAAKTALAQTQATLSGAVPRTDAAGFLLTLSDQERLDLEAQADRLARTVRRGDLPTGSEPPSLMDVVRAILAHLLGLAPAAAFRIPASQPAAKGGQTGRRPKLQVVK